MKRAHYKIAQYAVGLLIVTGLAVPAAVMATGSDSRKAAAVSPIAAGVRARSQMRAVRNAFRQKPNIRGSARYREREARIRRTARRNYEKWSKSTYFGVRKIRIRYKTIRFRRK